MDGKMIWILKKGMMCFGFIWRRRMTVGVALANFRVPSTLDGLGAEDFFAVWVTIDFSRRRSLV